jgi:hypothetical protein
MGSEMRKEVEVSWTEWVGLNLMERAGCNEME